ncbi:hypothetical protein ACJJIE_10365 [Microbulbifer sp. TRSA001]|uniref:hypothetical protein n=1 Tax=Microbulbifer sp. TRSA001 TaxID=3243381 RepID=UPI004039C579
MEAMLSKSQLFETYRVLGLAAMHPAGAEYKVAWAMTLLESGADTESLAELATFQPPFNEFEIDDYFGRVLKELAIARPPDDDSLMGYAKVIAQECVEGKIKPEIAASKLYSANVDLDYPEYLNHFTELEDEWYCEHINGWTRDQRKNEIIKACQALDNSIKFPVFRSA